MHFCWWQLLPMCIQLHALLISSRHQSASGNVRGPAVFDRSDAPAQLPSSALKGYSQLLPVHSRRCVYELDLPGSPSHKSHPHTCTMLFSYAYKRQCTTSQAPPRLSHYRLAGPHCRVGARHGTGLREPVLGRQRGCHFGVPRLPFRGQPCRLCPPGVAAASPAGLRGAGAWALWG